MEHHLDVDHAIYKHPLAQTVQTFDIKVLQNSVESLLFQWSANLNTKKPGSRLPGS